MVEEVFKVKGKVEKLEYYEVALESPDKKKIAANVAPDGKILKSSEEKKKE
jgi:hypothetical protein